MFIYVAGVSRTSRVDDGDDVAPFENCVRFGAFLFESAMSVFPFDLVFVSTPFSISSWGTTEIDLVLLCLSLAATSQMHAHDVCVLCLLRLWICGSIDAIVEIKNETVWRSLKWNVGSWCARLAFFR